MIRLIDNPLIENVIWAIISFLTININSSISTKYVTEVNFRNSYFFQSDKTKLTEFYSLDSVSLSKNAMRTFSNLDREVLEQIVEDSTGIYLMRLLKGRFYIGTDPFKIDIAILDSDTEFAISVFDRYDNYIGNIVWKGMLVDTTNMKEKTKELYTLLGSKNFNIIFTFLHEVSHFKNFIETNATKVDGKWFYIKKRMKTEWEIDREAEKYIEKYYDEIIDIYNTYKVPEKEEVYNIRE